jgi:hypothetical protein
LQECSFLELGKRLPELLLRIHHNRSVPGQQTVKDSQMHAVTRPRFVGQESIIDLTLYNENFYETAKETGEDQGEASAPQFKI